MNTKSERTLAVAKMYGESPNVADSREHSCIREAVEASHRGESTILEADQSKMVISESYWSYVNQVLEMVTTLEVD